MKLPDDPRFQRLHELLGTVFDLEFTLRLCNWDLQTFMPAPAAEERARRMATLARLHHEHATSDELGELLDELSGEVDLASTDDVSSYLRIAKREYDKARRLPAGLVAQLTEAGAQAQQVWAAAREANDFERFRPALARVVALTIETAERLGYEESRYDALLDQYEPGARAQQVQALFEALKAELVPLLQTIASAPQVDDAFLQAPFDADALREAGRELLPAIGFELARGRLDYSAHPFSAIVGHDDVRLTTMRRADGTAPFTGLFATVHEGGHGVHGQNFPAKYRDTPITAIYPGHSVLESQSRLFENMVARSRRFWNRHYAALQKHFPDRLGQVDVAAFYRAINKVQPSFIRVAADELTYHLHIILRFELEQEIIAERLPLDQLPAAWNAKMEAYLGITPPTAGQGVLQDVHWSGGAFGYFPTYSMGSLLSAQLFEVAVRERPEITAEIEAGSCAALKDWLIQRVYVWGSKLTPDELVRQVTGSPLSAQPFLRYARRKFGEIYGVDLGS